MSQNIGTVKAGIGSNGNNINVTQCSQGVQVTIYDRFVYLDRKKAEQLISLIKKSIEES